MSDEGMSNFTPRAQQTLALARKEAEKRHHNFIGTEHVLLGLVALGQGVAFNVLQRLSLWSETISLKVEEQIGPGPDQAVVGVIPYTPRVKKVLSLASKEAKMLNHTYVGTEHLLLGLLREGDGVGFRVLFGLGLNMELLRQEVLKELDPNYQPEIKTERKGVSKMTYEVLNGYIAILSFAITEGLVFEVVGAINAAKVAAFKQLIDADYFRVESSKAEELVDCVIRGSDSMDIFQLCVLAYRRMITPDNLVVSRVATLFSGTTPGSPEEKRFGTVLQILTGKPVQRIITLDFLGTSASIPAGMPSGDVV